MVGEAEIWKMTRDHIESFPKVNWGSMEWKGRERQDCSFNEELTGG